MPLTILMISNNYTPYSGGVVSSIQTSAHILRSQGHRVIIATLSFTPHDIDEADTIRIPAYCYFTYKNNPCCIPKNARKLLETVIQEYSPDIIHSHHPFLLGMIAVQLSKKHKIPLVFTHHTQYEQYAHYIPVPRWLTRAFIKKRLDAYCIRAQHIIAPSTSLAQQLPITHYTVIPSCIRTHFIHMVPPKKPKEITELITVSRFTPEKNIPFLLKVYSLLPQNTYKLTLFGFGHELENLKKLAYTTYNLDRRYCTFVEYPTQEQLMHAYQHAHLFIFASKTETQGLVIAESLAAATPVIALDATGVQDAVIDGYNGFLVRTAEEFAAKIELASLPALYKKLSQNAWHSACQYYPHMHGDVLIRTYSDVIKKFLNCHGSV